MNNTITFDDKQKLIIFYLTLMLDTYHDFIDLRRGDYVSMMGINALLQKIDKDALEDVLKKLKLENFYCYSTSKYRVSFRGEQTFAGSSDNNISRAMSKQLVKAEKEGSNSLRIKDLFIECMINARDLIYIPGKNPQYLDLIRDSIQNVKMTMENKAGTRLHPKPWQQYIFKFNFEISMLMDFNLTEMFLWIKNHKYKFIENLTASMDKITLQKRKKFKHVAQNMCNISKTIFNMPAPQAICQEYIDKNNYSWLSTLKYNPMACRPSQISDAQSICNLDSRIVDKSTFPTVQAIRLMSRQQQTPYYAPLSEKCGYHLKINYKDVNKDVNLLDIKFPEILDKNRNQHSLVSYLGLQYFIPHFSSAKKIMNHTNSTFGKTLGDLGQVLDAIICNKNYVTSDYFSILTSIPLISASTSTTTKIYIPLSFKGELKRDSICFSELKDYLPKERERVMVNLRKNSWDEVPVVSKRKNKMVINGCPVDSWVSGTIIKIPVNSVNVVNSQPRKKQRREKLWTVKTKIGTFMVPKNFLAFKVKVVDSSNVEEVDIRLPTNEVKKVPIKAIVDIYHSRRDGKLWKDFLIVSQKQG